MNNLKSSLRRLKKIFLQNTFISLFIVILVLGCLYILFRLISGNDQMIYAKVKVSQGLWWANTAKPSIWMVESLQKGDTERSLGGKPVAEILEVRYYPIGNVISIPQEQYDIYLLVKMRVSHNAKTGKYTFKRSTLSAGTPVDFEFSHIALSATVMSLSDKPIHDDWVTKVVTFKKMWGNSWDEGGVEVGDSYFDGQDEIMKVIDKKVEPTVESYNSTAVTTDRSVDVTIKTILKVRKEKGSLIFREEFPLQIGRKMNLATSKGSLNEFYITNIEENNL